MNVTDEPDETGYNWVAPPKASESVVTTAFEFLCTLVLLLQRAHKIYTRMFLT